MPGSLPHCAHPQQGSAPVTVCDPTQTRRRHPRLIVYTGVHSWWCTYCGCRQMCKDHFSVLQSSFIALKPPCVPPIHSSFPANLWQPLLSLLSPESGLFQNVRIGILQYAAFSHRLPSRRKVHFRVLRVLSGWMAPFFSALITSPSSGRPTACLSVHLLKDVSVASEFQQLWIKLLLTLRIVGF